MLPPSGKAGIRTAAICGTGTACPRRNPIRKSQEASALSPMRTVRGRSILGAESTVDAGAHRAKIAALVLLGLGVAFYLMFAVGETAGGDISGVQHFLPAAILIVLLRAAWKRPRAAGIALLALAVPLGIAYVTLLVVRDLPPTWALIVVLPPVVTGLLLVRAGRREHTSA